MAVATPVGHSALGTVRISGPATLALLTARCRSTHSGGAQLDFGRTPRHAHYVDVTDETGAVLDSGIVIFFAGPRSFTGQDSAEITVHGNPHLLRRLAVSLTGYPGVRLAEGGEFTRRAFLNGKIDLAQAEGIRRMIEARGEYELQASQALVHGDLSRRTARFRESLISLKAETEAEVDFSTEDLTFESREERIGRVEQLLADLRLLLRRGEETARLSAGIQLAVVGPPNAGKSSLLNLMLGWDRSIVSSVPGTTRDFVAEELHIDGVALRVVDTAGLRHTDDVIEKEGVRRTQAEMGRSQILLHVIDGSIPAYDFPEVSLAGHVVHVLNKTDRLHARAGRPAEGTVVELSCKTGQGLEELRGAIRDVLFAHGGSGSDPVLLEDRHRIHLVEVEQALQSVLRLWSENAPDEVTALEIGRALDHVGRITGEISTEEVLGRIFSSFCVGK